MKIIAHRGDSFSYPENTALAFKSLKELDPDGVEFDLHLTKDNQVVVIHDETIDRTSNGSGYIKDYELKELKKFNFASNFDKKLPLQKILTLDQTLEIVKELPIINIEIKNIGEFYQDLEKLIVKTIENFNIVDQTIVSSFNHQSLFKIKKYNKDIDLAPLFFARIHNGFNYLKKMDCKYIHTYYNVVDKVFIKNLHEKGIKVNTFTVNKKIDMLKMQKIAVDGIITDNLEAALNTVKNISD